METNLVWNEGKDRYIDRKIKKEKREKEALQNFILVKQAHIGQGGKKEKKRK